ncbi:MAG: amidohydrolase family protein [Acidimicrobiia bacterium]|nr:amidohydrolase family protein [Acidimicrobiia bacterium]MDQ3391206.1 amidohydrolase family protein [Actinomycetota bacterium]
MVVDSKGSSAGAFLPSGDDEVNISPTTPGLVCAHHHLYSALARGMPAPPRTPREFSEILELVWWRLDRALDLEMLRWSAMLGALEALESGCTALIDHHESPEAIEGSLSVIADACAEVGVRASCAYGVTDRHGGGRAGGISEGARRGLDENDRFLAGGGQGMVGMHAAFTSSDDTIAAAAELAIRHGVGVHVHVAEGPADADAPERLRQHSKPDWLLVHGVHLADDHGLAGTIVHNPRSNMNNAVGYARPSRFANPVALGTDGIGAAMLDEFRLAYVRHREDDVSASPDDAWRWLGTGWELMPEAGNDTITWSYDQMDPWSLAFTTGVRPLEVVVDGEVVLRDGVSTRVDAGEVRARAAEQARRLFARLEEMP